MHAAREISTALTAIRSQPWAILPEYLAAIEAIAARAGDAEVLKRLAADGHAERLADARQAVAATGYRLEGTKLSTINRGTAVVPILGPIFPRATLISSSTGGAPLDAIMDDFKVAAAAREVKRIVLLVDSPGGVVSGLGDAAATIRSTAKRTTAFVTGMAASAAYWLASQAREVVLDPAASVGAIGVVATLSRQVRADASGFMLHQVVSRNAPRKRLDPAKAEDRAVIRRELDALEAVFIADVARGRRATLAHVRANFGRGGMVGPQRAVRIGMADRVGTLAAIMEPAVGRPARLASGRMAAMRELIARRAQLH